MREGDPHSANVSPAPTTPDGVSKQEERPSPRQPWRRPWVRRALAVLGTSIVAPLAVYGFIQVIEKLRDPPPIEQQLDDISREIVADGRRVIIRRRVDYRGVGATSYYLVIRDEAARKGANEPGSGRSDELRVYDEIDGHLKRKLTFLPVRSRTEQPLFTRFDGAKDFDRDGLGEVIGAYGEVYKEAPGLFHPFVVRWEQEAGRYRVSGLMDDLRPFVGRSAGPIATYRGHADVIRTVGVDEYELIWSPRLRDVFLTTASNLRPVRDGVAWDVRSWSVNWKGPSPLARECGLSRRNRRLVAPSPLEIDLRRQLARLGRNPLICP